jgi:hypothetical protein
MSIHVPNDIISGSPSTSAENLMAPTFAISRASTTTGSFASPSESRLSNTTRWASYFLRSSTVSHARVATKTVGMGESCFRSSSDVRPVLDDDDESFERRCGKGQGHPRGSNDCAGCLREADFGEDWKMSGDARCLKEAFPPGSQIDMRGSRNFKSRTAMCRRFDI